MMRQLHPSFPTILFDDKDQSCRLGSSMIRWDIRDLDYFLACCKAGSFTAAARDAHIVQSATSSAIARLERDLGVQLFDRSVMPVALTEHGRRCRRAHSGSLTLSRQPATTLRPSLARSAARLPWEPLSHTGRLDLARVLANVRDRHPDVVIKLRQSNERSVGLLQSGGGGSMDIALSLAPPNMSLINRRVESLPTICLTLNRLDS
jgi:DNA-binding transcriptional LysR family regulator